MAPLVTISTCSLNQWVLDFEGNTSRIIESIRIAKAAGARLRVGPELEITGYSCQDHFLEGDLYLHVWQCIATIIDHPDCQDILIDIGAPIRYNARIHILNRRILLIKPKMWLAGDANYYEYRWFTSWAKPRYVEDYYLERIVGEITGQATVPIGDAVISTYDSAIGIETCEELFTPNNPGIHMGLNGVEIFTNSSGSHHELRKLKQRIDLIRHCTRGGGIYLYANQRGEDGNGRLYFDGSAGIFVNGRVVGMSSQFSLKDVDVVTAVVDLEEVRSTRTSVSRSSQGSQAPAYRRIEAAISLSKKSDLLNPNVKPSPDIELEYHSPEEEIALGPACWLWDYLRRSRQSGFFLPLSGGLDSASVAVITFSMCRLVVSACRDGNQAVIADVRRIVVVPEDSDWLPDTPQELCGKILHTCYMGTTNSSKETRNRAKQLAKSIGSYHIDLDMDSVVSAISNLFTFVTNFTPRFSVHGGTATENLALQNIQARSRLVVGYMFAQLLPLVRQRPGASSLLVLASEYDCSSADLNPIGSIDKRDLINFLTWAKVNFDIPIIESFVHAIPTAELEPITENYTQSDEDQMGMTYAELSVFGRLRKIMNRHKQVVLTPSYHAENYSCDDNRRSAHSLNTPCRHDQRPILYPAFFPFQNKKIEEHVRALERRAETPVTSEAAPGVKYPGRRGQVDGWVLASGSNLRENE
ncbi:glutamine-dependent NAD(+) synthetase [Histoplasma capsulatum var. duboisii H88]|uniref:Glutamine-dependent NAD(+) synthetase n=1 Tax=Ajellomyces capsulatus (strain H88) TaxID=544711 RepID=F0UVK9_AJEC8|nr:glutamine-dependent NAD(+) synthetase [Histoplasma capsulatum var. duboisii H88]